MDQRFAYWPMPTNPERAAHLCHATLATEYRMGSVQLREVNESLASGRPRRDRHGRRRESPSGRRLTLSGALT